MKNLSHSNLTTSVSVIVTVSTETKLGNSHHPSVLNVDMFLRILEFETALESLKIAKCTVSIIKWTPYQLL